MENITQEKQAFGRSIESGLEQVSADHQFLVQSFARVLESLGVSGASKLYSRDFSDSDGVLDPQTIQAISFYFQLLNLVEDMVREGAPSREKELSKY